MGAVKELWWVIIMIGGPALIAVLWEKHQERKWRKTWRVLTDWELFGMSINESVNKGYADEVGRQRQVRKDDQIFKTVEEYRNATD